MAYQPIDYTSGNGFLQGLQGAGLYQRVQQQKAQAEQQQAEQQQLQQFQRDWQTAYSSGDPAALDALVAKYPQQMETVQKAIGFRDDNHRMALGNAARDLRVAAASGDPAAFARTAMKHKSTLQSVGSTPEQLYQQFQQDPKGTQQLIDTVGMSSLGVKDYYGVESDRNKLAETVRSHKAGEALQRRGQDITMRGQDITSATSRRGQDMAMQRTANGGGNNDRTVQLADGRTVNVSGNVHGSGANAFYEGIDNDGNMVRVPANSIAAPATSAAIAQNYAMKKDIDAIADADAGDLNFMTGITGGTGSPALFTEQRSRITSVKQRNLYNASRRIQGRMQNQGVAAARDMGASGINTVAEAKMYFQGMPQVDYSSPEAMQESLRSISEYTDNYNRQYQVNVGEKSPPAQKVSTGSFTSKNGIQFKVE
ncbi:DNA transfer protein [Erwinia psidii]|uniref:phage DNA ejection protein n=1 Tax=Erwinia psidii TaxID=69224 RepID=UPI00226B2452|nr:phage DNA ejection protein [Erwinia psidii]MCX8965120.1 DNA transfer protein [Erwinia psidii]